MCEQFFLMSCDCIVLFPGGFCFAYNADLFYRDIFPGYDLGWSLFVVTFLVGSVGVVIGGVTSDSIVKKYGIRSRVAVLAISQVCEHGNTRNFINTNTLPPIMLLSSICHMIFCKNNLVKLVNYIPTNYNNRVGNLH